ncbi:MAG TPA: rhomboid family intramembrane serine protease [Candidatus Eremiobacteraceae bacterium]|nr:rhomboid family intramembrane serine protease [Candidatus Eremiobacteraceae bacterium]
MAQYRPFSGSSTPVVFGLLIAFAALFLLAFFDPGTAIVAALVWTPSLEWIRTLQLWQPFTFPFVHIAFLPLAVDGIVLYFFGGSLERAWGGRRFAFFFFASGIIAGFVIMLISPISAPPPFFGMIGSFIAVVVAFAVLNPTATVYFYFFPLQARWLALIVIAIEFFADYNRYGGIGPAAAVIAAASTFAWAFTEYRPRLPIARGRGPSLRERIERWQQRRRMRSWQRRVSRIDKPEDLFKR